MRKILLLLAFITSIGAFSQTHEESATLVVSLKDGNSYRFYIPAKSPTLQFHKGVVSVNYLSGDGEEASELSIGRDNLEKIFFEDVETIIQTPQIERHPVSFNLLQPGIIAVNELSFGDRLQIFGIDGRCLMNVSASSDGQTIIDLTKYAHGIYIIIVNKVFSFKYMKP